MKCWLCGLLLSVLHVSAAADVERKTLHLSMPTEAEAHFQKPTKPIPFQRLIKALDTLGYDLELVFNPGLRSMAMANTGRVDGLFARPATIEATYTKLVRVDEPISYSRPGVYGFERVNWATGGIKRMVALRGSGTFYQAFVGFEEKYELVKINSIEQALQLLRVGRAEAIMAAAVQMDYYRHFNKDLTEGLLLLEPKLEAEPLYVYLHESHAGLANQLAQALRAVPQALDE